MSDYVTHEMVGTAARASWEAGREPNHPTWDDLGEGLTRAAFRKENRAALEAVAPLIAATALRDAADDLYEGHGPRQGMSVREWLEERATAIERDHSGRYRRQADAVVHALGLREVWGVESEYFHPGGSDLRVTLYDSEDDARAAMRGVFSRHLLAARMTDWEEVAE